MTINTISKNHEIQLDRKHCRVMRFSYEIYHLY